MAEPKTTRTKASVKAFIDAVEHDRRRADARVVLKLMKEVTGKRPAMWGPSIVGFDTYDNGSGNEWPVVGFSPRKANLVLYIMSGFSRYGALLKKLGKHKTGKSCLYLNTLDDVDLDVLRELVAESVEHVRAKYA